MRRFFNNEVFADDSGNIGGLRIENIPTVKSSSPFGLIVSAIDSNGYPRKATAPISTSIGVNTGTGLLSVISGNQTIQIGQYSAMFNVKYSNPIGENGVKLQATASGLSTAISNEFNLTPEPPAAPTYLVRMSRSRASISLSWNNPSNTMTLLVGKKATTIDMIENEAEWNNWNTADLVLANLAWGSAPQLPNNEGVFMLYYGSATVANVTGLTRNTAYSFAVYSLRDNNGKAMFNMNEVKLLNQVTLN